MQILCIVPVRFILLKVCQYKYNVENFKKVLFVSRMRCGLLLLMLIVEQNQTIKV